MDPRDVHEDVKTVVKAWSRAENLGAAARALRDGRQDLAPELAAQLVSEIAEISAELMVEMLTMEAGIEPVEASSMIDAFGGKLHPKQAERISTWAFDQKTTCEALGINFESWAKHLEAGMDRFLARARGEQVGQARHFSAEQARALLGQAQGGFTQRADPAKSAKAGLTGLIAARGFKKK